MKINRIKHLCLALLTGVLLAVMTASASVAAASEHHTLTSSNTTDVPPLSPDGVLKIPCQSGGNIHVTPGSVATGNPPKVIVTSNGQTVQTQEDPNTHVITLVDPTTVCNTDIQVLLIKSVDLILSEGSGNIDIGGVTGQMTLTMNSGRINLNGGTLAGTSQLQVTGGGGISWKGGSLASNSTGTLSVGQGDIAVQFPANLNFQLDSTPSTTATGCSVQNGGPTLKLTASTINIACS